MKSVKSCGAIIYIKENDRILYLIVKHKEKDGGHWHFVKGHVDQGETQEQTATREIKEEVGLDVTFDESFKETTSYIDHIHKQHKTVIFFLAKANTKDVTLQEDELDDFAWMQFYDALEQLTHADSKDLLAKAKMFLQ